MTTYLYSVMVQVEVEALDQDDATEAVKDCFGEGENCGLTVLSSEVLDFEELR